MLGRILFLLLSISIFDATADEIESMNQEIMEQIVKDLADESEGSDGVVQFRVKGLPMYLISDAKMDRMRIIAPIAEYTDISREQLDHVMESNFHSALDARYAVSDNILYSAYIHPLSKLDEQQIQAAVIQVFNLAASFGTEYSSGLLSYGNRGREDIKEKIDGIEL